MRAGARPATLYDGRVARAQPVWVHIANGAVELDTGDTVEVVPLAELTVAPDPKQIAYRHRDRDGWRLIFPEPLPDAWASQMPAHETWRTHLDRIGLGPALAMGGAGIAVLVLIWATFIDLVLAVVPPSAFADLGDAMVAQLEQGSSRCAGATGQRALDALAGRMFELDRFAEPVSSITVLDSPVENALAAPGGHVVIFRGLIEKAESPDALAGVLAHELAHVEQRHATRGVVRGLGLGLIAQAFGGDIGAITQGFLQLAYGRNAERAADREALAALARIDASPAPLAAFFGRLSKPEDKLDSRLRALLTYVSTHPDPGDRQADIRAAVDTTRRYVPALSATQWQAVRVMCVQSANETWRG